jgi:S1-C subfamily serine protease
MAYRLLRIPVLLVVVAALATFVIVSKAGPRALRDGQPTFRIVAPDVTNVITQDVTPEIARSLRMSRTEGVLVSDVDSPLHPGDVILAVNGKPVRCQRELDEELAQIDFGSTFFIDVYRDGRIQTVAVRRAPEGPQLARVSEATGEVRGISVASLSNENGVLVMEVRIGTPASDLGLKRGDIILDVDGHPVHSAEDFLELMGQVPHRATTFNVQHRSGWVDVFVVTP